MNSIWNNNIEAFKQRFPQLSKMYEDTIVQLEKALKEGDLPPFWEIKSAKSGEISAVERGLSLHSAYNPVREAGNAVKQKEVAEKSITIFFGFGLGYHLIEWAKEYKNTNKKLIIIEPDIAHFFAALSLLDWREVFKVQQLVIALNCPEENILGLIEDQNKVNIGNTGVSDSFIFNLPSFTAHAQSYFNTVKTIIDRNIQKNKINEATLKKFGKLWCKNSLKNALQLSRLSGISSLENKTKAPFLLLGAGPSLEEVLPYLKDLNKHFITISVETALGVLLKNDFQPDFIILLDPQYWAYKHIAGLHAKKSILITEITAYPSSFTFDCSQILLCASQFPVGKYFEKKLELNLGDLGTGGSVASSAWNFAHFAGSEIIYTAGLDLAFPEKETHIRGSSAEQTFHKISEKRNSSEKMGLRSLFSANAQKGRDYRGRPVLTDSRMKMFAWWFESRLAACPQVKTYTLCPKGLKIPGIEVASIEKALSLPLIEKEKSDFIKSIKKSCADEEKIRELLKNFPQKDFIEENDFLLPYL